MNMPATNVSDIAPRKGGGSAAVSLEKLCKTYRAQKGAGEKRALIDVDLEIPQGSLFGLLGPNGAGKSTLINILAGLVNKTSGKARVWGIDIDENPRQARAAIGVVPQELNIDPFFTPYELMEIQAGLYGVPPKERQTDEILAAMGLADKSRSYTRSLSGGMRRRLMVAKSMVHRPPILVLDEPTAGVDIELRRQLWAYVRRLNAEGTTVLLTTHYLEEAEELCDTIAIINKGRVIACDRTPDLLKRLDGKELTVELTAPLQVLPQSLIDLGAEQISPERLLFRYRKSEPPLARILETLRSENLTLLDVTTDETDLEDIFLQLTREETTAGE